MSKAFIDGAPTLDTIEAFAEANGHTKYRSAIMLEHPKYWQNVSLWPEPNDSIEITNPEYYADVDLCAYDGGKDLLSRLSRSISKSVQFPSSTTFVHGLAVVGATLCRNFYIEQYGSKKPITIYAVTAQPPSTGKSAVNNYFCHPVRDCFSEINERNKKRRNRLLRDMRSLEREMEAAEKKGDRARAEKIEDELFDMQEEVKKFPDWRFAITDATPEALEEVAGNQQGIVNVISAEAEAVNVMLGGVYGEKKSNFGIVLSAWDGEIHESARISRNAYTGYIRMCIAVMAQDESIDSILAAGMSGRGVSERVFILRERTLLGNRDLMNYESICADTYLEYKRMIQNVMAETDRVVLKMTRGADMMIKKYRADREPKLGDDGTFSNTMLRGFVGKSGKHISHIAAILHCIEQWSRDGKKSKEISEKHVEHAIFIFDHLVDFYVKAADAMGYAGKGAEIEAVKNYIMNAADRGKLKVSIQQIRDSVKAKKAFSGVTQINNRLRDVILPALEAGHYCCQWGSTVYINPRLK